jgi:hypothetical protein
MSNTYSVSNVNIGTVANDGQGDPLRTAFVKINQNFVNVYAYANLAYYNGLGGGGGNIVYYNNTTTNVFTNLFTNVTYYNNTAGNINVIGLVNLTLLNAELANIRAVDLSNLNIRLANLTIDLGILDNKLANVSVVNLGAVTNALANISNITSLGNLGNIIGAIAANANAVARVSLVSNLSANGTANGQQVYNTTDGGLYIWQGNSWVSPGAAFTPTATSISGVEIFTTFSLPTGPGDGRDFNGRQGFYNGNLYLRTSGAWSSYNSFITGSGTPVLSAGIITATELAAGSVIAGKIGAAAISAAEIAAGAITANLIASNSIIAGKIAAGVISATEIAAGAITADKIGASSIYAGAIQANAITAGKIASNAIFANNIAAFQITAGKIEANAITATEIAAGAIFTRNLTAGCVSANEIAVNSIYAGAIQAGAIAAGKIDAGAITADKIAVNAVYAGAIQALAITSAKIDTDAITADKIATNAVTAGKILAGAITADKIAAGAITADKIAAGSITADRIDTRGLTIKDSSGATIISAGGLSGSIPVAIIGGGSTTLQNLASSSTAIAKFLDLQNDHPGFGVSGGPYTNTPEITLTAVLTGLTGTVTFAVTAGTATLTSGTTPNSRKLTFANMGSDSVTITATITDSGTTYSDLVSLFKVYNGVNGTTTPLMYLTDENKTVVADSSGTVSSFAGVSTEAVVYEGLSVSTASWTFTSTASGCTISTSGVGNKVINVTAMSADTATVTIVATRSGYASLTRVFNLSKAKAGPQGPAGTNGTNGSAGTRGSIRTSYPYPGPWSDAIAVYAISLAGGGSPRVTDEVTLYSGSYSETKVFDGTNWSSVVATFNGSILINGTVIASKIATGAITADKIGADAVTAGKIQAGAITADKIQAGAITADKISASTISADKIQSSTGTTVSYGKYGFGAGAEIGNYNGVLTAETLNPNYFGIIGASNTSQPGIVAGNRYGLQAGEAFAFFRMSGGQYSSSPVDWRTYGTLGGYLIGGQIIAQNDVFGPAPGTNNSIVTLAHYGVAAGNFTQLSYGGVKVSEIKIADALGNALRVVTGTIVTGAGVVVSFTGSHDGLVSSTETVELGDILVDVSIVATRDISDAISILTKSKEINQKSVLGVLRSYTNDVYIPHCLSEEYDKIIENNSVGDAANIETEPTIIAPTITKAERLNPIYQTIVDNHKFVYVNSIGEGLINVCGENGDIEIGDYITTSSIPGKGMKQSDDLMHNYTVAKARENVTFSSPTEVKQIACSYHCG